MTTEGDHFDLTDLNDVFSQEVLQKQIFFQRLVDLLDNSEIKAKCLQAIEHDGVVVRTHQNLNPNSDMRLPTDLEYDEGDAYMSLCADGFAEEGSVPSDSTVVTIRISQQGLALLRSAQI